MFERLPRPVLAAALAAAPLAVSPAAAAVLTPSADAFIRGGSNANANQNGGNAQNLLILPGNDLNFARKAYLRFDLSSITADVTDAQLSLDISFSNTAVGGAPLNIWGLNDGSGDNWSETGITWNNAPGNQNNPAGTTGAALLGQIVDTGEVATPGTFTFTLDTDALLAFIQADGNDAVTFIITGSSGSNGPVRPIIASRENAGPPAARLDLTLVPEPASMALVGLSAVMVMGRRRR